MESQEDVDLAKRFNHVRLGPISRHEATSVSQPREDISLPGLTPAAQRALNEVLRGRDPSVPSPPVVKRAGIIARVECTCGWAMEVSQPPATHAEEDASNAWRDHVALEIPPQPGEEFYPATWQVETQSWYKGAIRSGARWRPGYPKWICDHHHEGEAEALACAEAELPQWLAE
jgi:hypothetical protein